MLKVLRRSFSVITPLPRLPFAKSFYNLDKLEKVIEEYKIMMPVQNDAEKLALMKYSSDYFDSLSETRSNAIFWLAMITSWATIFISSPYMAVPAIGLWYEYIKDDINAGKISKSMKKQQFDFQYSLKRKGKIYQVRRDADEILQKTFERDNSK